MKPSEKPEPQSLATVGEDGEVKSKRKPPSPEHLAKLQAGRVKSLQRKEREKTPATPEVKKTAPVVHAAPGEERRELVLQVGLALAAVLLVRLLLDRQAVPL